MYFTKHKQKNQDIINNNNERTTVSAKNKNGSKFLFLAAALFLSAFIASPAGATGLQTIKQDLQESITQSSENVTREVVSSSSSVQLVDELVVGKVTAKYKLNVRKSPWGEIIDGFLPGKLVDILGREGEFYKIRYGNNGFAYVHTSLISIETGTPKTITEQLSLPASGMVIAKYKLNVRNAPWGEIIDGFSYGTQVEVTGCEGEWYIINYNGNDGKAYVHNEFIRFGRSAKDENTTPASGQTANTTVNTTTANTNTNPATPSDTAAAEPTTINGINGPYIPAELKQGVEAAKRTQWYTTPDKCLQFAGTVAHEAGAPNTKVTYTQPQAAWPAIKTLRGYYINQLPKAVEEGKLLPGMLIHVKVHYDYDPAYNPTNDAHHWFVYMGKDAQGVPRFSDNLKASNFQTAEQVYNYMNGGSAKKYGDAKYGYNRRVTAVYDPFASER